MVQGEVQMFNAIYRKQVLRHWERFSKVTNSCFSSVMNILPMMLVPSAVFGNVATQILLALWVYGAIELTVRPKKVNQKANAR